LGFFALKIVSNLALVCDSRISIMYYHKFSLFFSDSSLPNFDLLWLAECRLSRRE
jgi:hypothetical protein